MIAFVFACLLSKDPSTSFPTIETADLNGREVTLPEDFTGTRQLILIGYDRADQKLLDAWIEAAVALRKGEAELGIFELPIVDDPGSIGRGVITAGMKMAVRDRQTRSRIMTLFTDKAAAMRALGVSSDQTVDLLVVDERQQIIWRESGPVTDEKVASLRLAVDG